MTLHRGCAPLNRPLGPAPKGKSLAERARTMSIREATESGEAATVDIMATAMVERFGERAVAVATSQLAAAHQANDTIADRWLSIVLSVEARLGERRMPG